MRYLVPLLVLCFAMNALAEITTDKMGLSLYKSGELTTTGDCQERFKRYNSTSIRRHLSVVEYICPEHIEFNVAYASKFSNQMHWELHAIGQCTGIVMWSKRVEKRAGYKYLFNCGNTMYHIDYVFTGQVEYSKEQKDEFYELLRSIKKP